MLERWRWSRASRRLKGMAGIDPVSVCLRVHLYLRWSRDGDAIIPCSIRPPLFDDVLVVRAQKTQRKRDKDKKNVKLKMIGVSKKKCKHKSNRQTDQGHPSVALTLQWLFNC